MSEVRICDICDNIFSVKTEWRTVTMTSRFDGQYPVVSQSLDVCAKCAGGLDKKVIGPPPERERIRQENKTQMMTTLTTLTDKE